MSGGRVQPVRDQERSVFADILQNLVDAIPGALGAALVDNWGETVDYAGALEPFDIRVASAHMQLELRNAAERLASAMGPIRQMVVRARARSYVVRDLVDGYLLVVVLARSAGFGISERAFSQADYDLRRDGGWEPPQTVERWVHARVEVHPSDRFRPTRVQLSGDWHDVEVIGQAVDLPKGERGYRVRTRDGDGAEVTLVRERLGRWYADIRLG